MLLHVFQLALINEHFKQPRFSTHREGLMGRMFSNAHANAPAYVLYDEDTLVLDFPDAGDREPQRLREALRLNEPLAIAYHLKDELNEIWEQDDEETAQALLLDWIVYTESTGIRMLQQFAKTLRFHASGILAWYDYPISTGPLEGTNNKIKTMKRQAYGFRDPEFLRLKILGIHETPYALVG